MAYLNCIMACHNGDYVILSFRHAILSFNYFDHHIDKMVKWHNGIMTLIQHDTGLSMVIILRRTQAKVLQNITKYKYKYTTDKGPFKNDVTTKMVNFGPPSPPCHHLSLIQLTPLPPMSPGQIVTNFFSRKSVMKKIQVTLMQDHHHDNS